MPGAVPSRVATTERRFGAILVQTTERIIHAHIDTKFNDIPGQDL